MNKPELLISELFLPNSHLLFDTLVSKIRWDERIYVRKTASFGSPYNYSNISYESCQMLDELVPVIDRLEKRFGFRPNNCLANYYPNGDSVMGFHSDSLDELIEATGISIISLGAERIITFQNKQDKSNEHNYLLKSGSLIFMPQETQRYWKHGILKQPEALGRISLTFRLLK
ncbi:MULTISPECIES: alpha-ketoglutarate-dependent dioxygenase AlkB [Nostocales]|uniref:2OG-Fe(II) oxygenase n=3 Tax=Nostocales TaxID=1161 RepID=A0A0C1N1W9_9CYAN|nr:alpha-ketoglutarate-dependent dioxygenase AlkB [Tolypothrix bouteillei]KAF3883803.1 alpha-ketoglutarate-dependent dioxygenase AlkB [Tolypothrix bouteillei VB521301]